MFYTFPSNSATGRCRERDLIHGWQMSNGCVNFKTPILEHLENIISGTRHKLLTALAQHPSHILKIFLHKIKKTAFRSAVFLGEGIFTMGYSKNYI